MNVNFDRTASDRLVGMGTRAIQMRDGKRSLSLVDTTEWGSQHAVIVQ